MEMENDFFETVWANTKASDEGGYAPESLVIHRDLPNLCGRVVGTSKDGKIRIDYGSPDANFLEADEEDIVSLSNFVLIGSAQTSNSSNTAILEAVQPGAELIDVLQKLKK